MAAPRAGQAHEPAAGPAFGLFHAIYQGSESRNVDHYTLRDDGYPQSARQS